MIRRNSSQINERTTLHKMLKIKYESQQWTLPFCATLSNLSLGFGGGSAGIFFQGGPMGGQHIY